MRNDIVRSHPDAQGGTPCFAGTRVPVATLFDHPKQGVSVDEFLSDFPTVKRWQVDALLDDAKTNAEPTRTCHTASAGWSLVTTCTPSLI